MIERSRPAEAEGGPTRRGTWAGDKPLCRHCSTVAIYAQGRCVGEVRGANRPAARPAEPVAEQLPLPMEVAPWLRR